MYLGVSAGPAALGASIVFLTMFMFLRFRNQFSYWTKLGIKCPKPIPIFGNFLNLMSSNSRKNQLNWVREYGKCHGIYVGPKPVLVIADPEISRQISTKDFDAFPDHETDRLLNKYQKDFIFFITGQHWKRVRALMSPIFTSAKIKRMYKILQDCASDLLDSFESSLSKKGNDKAIVNLSNIYELYTLDAIASCCYGLRLQRAGSSDLKTAASRDSLARVCMKLFQLSIIRLFLLGLLPTGFLKSQGFEIIPAKNAEPLAKVARQILEKRKLSKNQKKFDDYLQILVDAKLDDELLLGDLDEKENHHAGLSQKSLMEDRAKMVKETLEQANCCDGSEKIGHNLRDDLKSAQVLTEMEIVTGAMTLLAVGLDTTSTMLTASTYALAFHQEVQERLYKELSKIFNTETKTFSYEDITSCQYLDSVISETLRLMPPLDRTDRKASRDYLIEKYNIQVRKGDEVVIANYCLQNDPDYWDEPYNFDPDRFMPGQREKIIPGTYCPFGLGPRHCLGMRFSLTESKLALGSLLMKYRFEPVPGTPFPPQGRGSVGLEKYKNAIVRVLPRAS